MTLAATVRAGGTISASAAGIGRYDSPGTRFRVTAAAPIGVVLLR